MGLHAIDWIIVFGLTSFLIVMAYRMYKYNKSSADFLAANRCAGRYVLTMSEGISHLGAITIVANLQVGYKAGFVAEWLLQWLTMFTILIWLTGWVIYRYRETQVLTLGQLFEIRYSKRFRIYAAILCWISGMVNFGVFPAIGANFFMYFCNLPQTYTLGILNLSTYHSLLAILIGVALFFTYLGGQIAVIVTDFFQSMFSNFVLVAILVVLIVKFPISDWFEAALISEPGQSRLNPFDAWKIKDYNLWYYAIGIFSMILNRMAWQGTQGYNASAKTPHEAKMAGVLSQYRGYSFMLVFVFIPVVAWMIMHMPKYALQADQVNQILSTIENPQVRSQLLVPATMSTYLPMGLMGAFVAMMLAAFLSTHDTYLHSWGSIFVQDVIMPFRKTPLTNKQHMLLLRLSIAFVAIFIFIFSSLFRQTQDVRMFFAITGTIWMGGAGVCIIGCLYTKWGTTAGAYASLTSGALIGIGGFAIERIWYRLYGISFPINAQWIFFFAMVMSITVYVVFSLLGKRQRFNLDKMLHRGSYAISSEHADMKSAVTKKRFRIRQIIGISEDFSVFDKVIYGWTIFQTLCFKLVNLVIAVIAYTTGWNERAWMTFHKITYLYWYIPLAVIYMIWLTGGSIRDAIRMFIDLRTAKRDYDDDGTVRNHDYGLPSKSETRND